MRVKDVKVIGSWREVADAARTTEGMDKGVKEPSSRWKKNILLAEHSPIRLLKVRWKWEDLKYWVSVHIVRHKFGIEHFVSTQRTDRTGQDRETLPQSALVMHECEANAQAIINISRKRLCKQASKETREAWIEFLQCLQEIEPELYSVAVPECIYRGFCPELRSCGFYKTKEFQERLESYQETGRTV